VVGGSDAHSVEAMGWGFTVCEEGTVEGLLELSARGARMAFVRRHAMTTLLAQDGISTARG